MAVYPDFFEEIQDMEPSFKRERKEARGAHCHGTLPSCQNYTKELYPVQMFVDVD